MLAVVAGSSDEPMPAWEDINRTDTEWARFALGLGYYDQALTLAREMGHIVQEASTLEKLGAPPACRRGARCGEWNLMTQAALPEKGIYAAIGEEGFARLIGGFYRRVAEDDILGPLYPRNDLAGATATQNRGVELALLLTLFQ